MKSFFKKAILWIAVTLACAILASVLTTRAKHRENAIDIIPVRDSIIEDYAKTAQNFGQTKTLFFLIESPKDARECSEYLESELIEKTELKSLTPKERDFFEIARIATLYTPNVFEESDIAKLEEMTSPKELSKRMEFFKSKMGSIQSFGYKKILLDDPLGISKIFLDKYANSRKAYSKLLSKNPKLALLAFEGNFDSTDSQKSRVLMDKVFSICKNVEKKFPKANIACAGAYRIATDNSIIATKDTSFCLKLTGILMILLCIAAFKNKLNAIAAILPSLLGTAIALIIINLALSEVSLISIAFASIAIGVGIDYAIHLIYALSQNPNEFPKKLIRPISVAAGTTLIAFATMCIIGSVGFFQIGIFGALSVFFSALLSFIILPKMIPAYPQDGKTTIINKLAEFILNTLRGKKRAILFTIATISLILIFLPKLKFDGNISNLSARTAESEIDNAKIRKEWEGIIDTKKIFVNLGDSNKTLSQVREIADFLKSENIEFQPVYQIIPDNKKSRENIARWKSFWTPQRLTEIENNLRLSAKANGIKPELLINKMKNSINGEASFEDIFNTGILKGIAEGNQENLTIAFDVKLPKAESSENFYKTIKEKFDGATFVDMIFFGKHISLSAKNWLIKFCALALFAISLYLIFALGGIRKTLRVITPVALGLVWTFSALAALGISVNIVNAIFVIFAVCMAQDYAMFLNTSKGDTRTLAAVLLSAATTICAFGTFAFAQHPMLHSLGITAALAIFSILVASILLQCYTLKLEDNNE